jgi:hypothetical protein
MTAALVMPHGIEWLYLLLWVSLGVVAIILLVRMFTGR